MTEKQEQIMQAALRLFAEEGFHATSTNKVARAAGVSEGLIFRHFGNKAGLLDEILQAGEERARKLVGDVIFEPDPRTMVRKLIELPFRVNNNPEEKEFWRLQYKLKWELDVAGTEKLQPLRLALTEAFRKLDYPQPELEAEFLVLCFDALGAALIRQTITDPEALATFLRRKYEVD